jgi:protein-S-isoprenylcysteine O-methyltransferase Ste14
VKTETRERIFIAIGLLGIAGFLYLYAVKLFGEHGQPPGVAFMEGYVGTTGVIIINIGVFACFLALLPYRLSSKESRWKSKGAFLGFLVALFTEMFGLPLVIFIFSPFFNYPVVLPFSRKILGSFGMIAGTWITLAGIALVVAGWHKIHKAKGLVTDGLYKYIRHPQYTGLFLIMLGWILHFPTLLTLIIFPVLVVAYYWLARKEERALEQLFGDEYKKYEAQTPRFFPRLPFRRGVAPSRTTF